uniref:Reverse transcriptase domain-containing protein n=1 Tax=Acrobeloides nanus TaxID=290746 RepID=A0A914EP50_9BILA
MHKILRAETIEDPFEMPMEYETKLVIENFKPSSIIPDYFHPKAFLLDERPISNLKSDQNDDSNGDPFNYDIEDWDLSMHI